MFSDQVNLLGDTSAYQWWRLLYYEWMDGWMDELMAKTIARTLNSVYNVHS